MLSTRLVTPEKRHNICQERLRLGSCNCWEAKYSQQCQSCHKRINQNDCITRNFSGWAHTECPIGNAGERGIRTIEAGFNNCVDYGSSFLRRLSAADGARISLPSPLRLDFGEPEDAKIPAVSQEPEDAKIPTVSQEPKEAKMSAVSQEPDDATIPAVTQESDKSDEESQEPKCKRAKREDSTSTEIDRIEDDKTGNGEYADEKRTNEQMAILSHEPKVGDVVVVNALAGCGKTTTIALLCNKFHNSGKKCLYLVYNASMEKDAMQSNKFPKMEIRTTHAYVHVLRYFFRIENMNNVNPSGDYKLDDIIKELDLQSDCRRIFGATLREGGRGKKTLERRVKTIAGYIRRSIHNFQSSADSYVKEDHVFWRAKNITCLSKRTKWREEISVGKYVGWAAQFFNLVCQKCNNIREGSTNERGISHDGYLKVAQLARLQIPHDYVCIDEAQDMTDCQADLFWGQHQRTRKRIYLFGDRYQQVYRFRGASRSFWDMVDASNPKFTLTGSFRFGKNIASCATCVLRALGGETLHGRSNDEGRVEVFVNQDGSQTMDSCTVLCRTQNGIFRYLHENRPARWSYLSGESKLPQGPEQWQLDLESFIKGQKDKGSDREDGDSDEDCLESASTFTYKGETFHTIQGINEYIDEEGDIELRKSLTLLKFLVSQRKPLVDFYSDLRASFSPLQKDESPDEYNGVIMSTVHKAKGLEFNCPVLIYADFRFEAIKSAVINRERHCDEANILYVAITRAKRHLYLTEKANSCLQLLSELSHVQVQLPSMFSLDSSRKKLSDWQDTFALFKEHSGLIESISDVPYPPEWNNDRYPLSLHHAMSISEQRKQLMQFLRIYHPDKFFPRFRHRMHSDMVEDITKILEQITRKCTEICGSLRGEEED